MKRIARATLATAGAALLASTASAAVLVPGASAAIDGWSALGGDPVYAQSYNFTAVGVPIGVPTATGVVDQLITSLPSGELVFSLRIASLMADPGLNLVSAKITKWEGFDVDANFAAGSGLSAPMMVSRSDGLGGVVDWTNFEEPMSDGKSSAWMQIATNAIGFTPEQARLHLTFSDGSFASIRVAAPSMIPAPGVAALLLGAAACCGIRRRR